MRNDMSLNESYVAHSHLYRYSQRSLDLYFLWAFSRFYKRLVDLPSFIALVEPLLLSPVHAILSWSKRVKKGLKNRAFKIRKITRYIPFLEKWKGQLTLIWSRVICNFSRYFQKTGSSFTLKAFRATGHLSQSFRKLTASWRFPNKSFQCSVEMGCSRQEVPKTLLPSR